MLLGFQTTNHVIQLFFMNGPPKLGPWKNFVLKKYQVPILHENIPNGKIARIVVEFKRLREIKKIQH
jgi:hypothetical protein